MEKAIGFGNWKNVDSTITRYYNVSFRYEVDSCIAFKIKFNQTKFFKIICHTNFRLTDQAIQPMKNEATVENTLNQTFEVDFRYEVNRYNAI